MMMPSTPKRNRLVDHVGLQGSVLTAVKDAKIDAERFGLGFNACEVSLEEVARGKIANQRDLNVACIVKRGWHAWAKCCARHAGGGDKRACQHFHESSFCADHWSFSLFEVRSSFLTARAKTLPFNGPLRACAWKGQR
jgi:hypothetical protein